MPAKTGIQDLLDRCLKNAIIPTALLIYHNLKIGNREAVSQF
jgi:hypothetical protein